MKKRITATLASAVLILSSINTVPLAYDGGVELSEAVFYVDGTETDYYEAGALKAILNAKNNSNKEQEIMLIGAVHSADADGSKYLTSVEAETFSLAAGEERKEIILDELSSDDDNASLTIYAFEKDTLSPIREAQTLPDYDSAVDKALGGFDEVFGEEMLDWLASLYHYESGGFYYSRSARDYEGFAPDIESSSQAYDILVGLDVIEGGANYSVPDYFREKNIEFMKTRQAEDGYFYDTQFGTNIGNSKKHRNFNQAYGALKRYNITPTYPLPSEYSPKSRIALMSTDDDYLSSPEALRAWLEDLFKTKDAYTAGNAIASSASAISNKPELAETAISYLKSIQNPSGFWYGKGETAGEINYAAVNGAMKISGIFKENNEPYPNIENMLQGTVSVILSGDIPGVITSVWNPLVLINNARAGYEELPVECAELLRKNMVGIIKQSIYKIKEFKKSDGGFSYNRYYSSPTSQGAYVGLGLAEGDINATYMGTQGMMASCYLLAGKRDEMPSFAHYKDRFFEKLLSEENRSYPKISTKETEIFAKDYTKESELGSYFILNGGKAEIKNSALNFATASGEYQGIKLNCGANTAKAYAFETKFKVNGTPSGNLFYNTIGDTAVGWVIAGDGGQIILRCRTHTGGNGTAFAAGLEYGKYHSLRIEYIPDGAGGAKIRFFVNDRFMAESTSHYYLGKYPAATNISRIDFIPAADAVCDIDIERVALYNYTEGFMEAFEGSSPDGWILNTSAAENGAKAEIAADPTDNTNKALKITSDSDTASIATTVSHSLLIPANIEEMSFSCRFMTDGYTSGEGFITSLGQTAVQWLIRTSSASVSLSNRSTPNGYGTIFKSGLAHGKWHNLKLVYRPNDTESKKISYYMDGELIYSTDEYYGSSGGAPSTNLNSISFSSFISTRANLWLDDIIIRTK